MEDIALAIAAVGCVFASVYCHVRTNGGEGLGWGIIAVLLLLSLKGCQ